MNLSKETQFCSEHSDRMNTLVCLNKSCKAKAIFCPECHIEKHSECNIKLVISLGEVVKKVIIFNSQTNGEQNKDNLRKIVTVHKQAFVKRFVNWMSCMLKAYDSISHEDLLNPLTIGLIKSNFNIELKEDGKGDRWRGRVAATRRQSECGRRSVLPDSD